LVTPDRRKATFHIHAEAKNPAKAEALLKEYARKVEEWQIEKELGIQI
jgi:hypothetical protein